MNPPRMHYRWHRWNFHDEHAFAWNFIEFSHFIFFMFTRRDVNQTRDEEFLRIRFILWGYSAGRLNNTEVMKLFVFLFIFIIQLGLLCRKCKNIL